MRISALSLFEKTNSPHTVTVAAWHSRHSITWQWVLHFSRFKADERRAHWRLVHASRINGGVMGFVLLPWIGVFKFQTQRPLWYRDAYTRLRDDVDHRAYVDSNARYEANLVAQARALRGDEPLH